MYSLEEAAFIRKMAFDSFMDNTLPIDTIISNLENCIKGNLRAIIASENAGSKKFKLNYIRLYFRWMQVQAIKNHTFPSKYEVLSIDDICSMILGEELYNRLRNDSDYI